MARDKIAVDLLLNTKKAEAEIRKINKELDKMGKTMGRSFSGGGRGGADKVRALGTGLSKATVRADEFNKSLEASNARVIAFGASAGLIMQVDRALKAMVASAIKVEKAMADVNVVMNTTNKNLQKFGAGMFRVAKDTAQSFDVVAEAATELARQGLSMEKTLSRTKDALILTRLTGMNAADAVKSLTAAVNSFNKAGITSTQVINKMAKVDAAFAVSSEDLARSIARVGSSAVDAGVSMDQLLAITTAVQQKTARGGAVIGNAFKTIFTRIQRTDVQQKLANIGVATRDMQGNMLDAVTVLRSLAGEFQNLSKQQQANIAENVAGVFQVNILRAALSDLSSEYSDYGRALKSSASATNEAYRRNEELNKSLDALVNKTLANLTQAGASLGGGLFGPSIEKMLGIVNTAIESFSEGGAMEGFGKTIGKGLITGIGHFISGPGMVAAIAIFGKLAFSLAKFAGTALKDIVGLNKATKQRAALEDMVVRTIAKEPALLKKVKRGTLDVLDVEKRILNAIRKNNRERRKLTAYGGPIAKSLHGRGARMGSSGDPYMRRGSPGGAAGFVPNFANPNAERAAAAAGGYKAGSIKTMSQPGVGSMMYNSAETVKSFPGMSQSAIMPPRGSAAGAGYKSAFGAAHGFDPYAAGGFVPNFQRGRPSKAASARGLAGSRAFGHNYRIDASDIGVLLALADGNVKPQESFRADAKSLTGLRKKSPSLYKNLTREEARITLDNVRVESFINSPNEATAAREFEGLLSKNLKSGVGNISKGMMKKFGIEGVPGSMGKLNEAVQGEIFEESMRMAMKAAVAIPGADFDFEASKPPSQALQKVFGKPIFRIDAKRRLQSARGGAHGIPKKFFNDRQTGKHGVQLLNIMRNDLLGTGKGRGRALGFVPNFSPLTDSIGREMSAGVPASAIRIGRSPTLRSAGNPGGVGVYNTIHEPGGLRQGIGRSRAMGVNPQAHGSAGGLVPNFAKFSPRSGRRSFKPEGGRITSGSDPFDPTIPKKTEVSIDATASNTGAMRRLMEVAQKNPGAAGFAGFAAYSALSGAGHGLGPKPGAVGNILGNVGMMAGAGFAMGGAGGAAAGGAPALITAPIGAAIGAAVGLVTSIGDIAVLFADNTKEIEEQLLKTAQIVGESIGKIINSVNQLADYDTMPVEQRMTKLLELEQERTKTIAFLDAEAAKEGANPMFANLSAKMKTTIPSAGAMVAGGAPSAKDLVRVQEQLTDFITQKDTALGLQNFMTTHGGFGKFAESFRPTFSGAETGIPTTAFRVKGGGANRSESQVLMNSLIGVQGAASIAKGEAFFEDPQRPGRTRSVRGMDELEKIGGLVRGGDAAAGMVKFIALLEKLGKGGMAKGLVAATGFGGRVEGQFDRTTKQGLGAQFAFSNMFRQGGMYGPDMLKAMRQPVGQKPLVDTDIDDIVSRAQRGAFHLQDRSSRATATAAQLKRTFAFEDKMASTQNQYATALAAATKNTIGLAEETKKLADVEAQRKKEQAEDLARSKKATAQATAFAKIQGEVPGYLAGAGFSKAEARKAQSGINRLFSMDTEQLRNIVAELAGERTKGPMTPANAAQFEFASKLLGASRPIIDEFNMAMDAATDEATKAKILNKLRLDIDKKQLDLSRQLNTAKMEELRITNAILGKQKVADAKRRMDAGKMSSAQYSSIYSANLDSQVAAYGVQEKDFGKAFQAGFVNEMGYNPVDYLNQFRDGSREVAQSMKSSFSTAFQSIASGANSVQGALANMAQSILNSISSISSDMFTNMMFSKMGWGNIGQNAHGGYVPGYAGGGVVTGGSGHQDDVLTRMQGGEYVIKKSAAQKIGYGTLNAINGYAGGGEVDKGPSMGQMGLIAAGASAASGMIGAAMQPGSPAVIPSQDYGQGRGKYGYFGGADPDVQGPDSIGGGGGRASASLRKGFIYYRRDPETGRLVSERARPTEGKFEVSQALSLLGRLDTGDPQTSRMFGKEQAMSKYQSYLETETNSRKEQIKAVERQKRGRLIGAYMNAAMLIGGAKFFGGGTGGDVAGQTAMSGIGAGMDTLATPQGSVPRGLSSANLAPGNELNFGSNIQFQSFPSNYGISQSASAMENQFLGPYNPPSPSHNWGWQGPGHANGGLARVMGGEFVMSPQAVRTHGTNFMAELNRGNTPSFAGGGPVGNQTGMSSGGSTLNTGGNTTNNVKINVNVDKSGKAEADSTASTKKEGSSERGEQEEVENNKELGQILQTVVLHELVKQQRPGGLLQRSPHTP